MKKFLQLIPQDYRYNSPSKTINKDGIIKSFDAGKKFFYEEVVYDKDFHDVMGVLLQDKNSFLILGKLTDFGIAEYEVGRSMARRKKDRKDGFGSSIEYENDSNIMILDLDDHKHNDWDPLNPVPTIEEWCNERGIDCDVTWQITSGQKLDTTLMRIRLYLICDKEYSLDYRKAWAVSDEISADGSVFSGNQPIYTTPPTFIDCEDFIPKRYGFIKGKRRDLILPDYSPKEVKKIIKAQFASFDYDDDLPESVKTGEVGRRYFMPLALSYANRGLKRNDIMMLIEAKVSMTTRSFDRENVEEYVDDALYTLEVERLYEQKLVEDNEIEMKFEDDDLKFTTHEWGSGFLGEFAHEIYEMGVYPKKEISIFSARAIIASLIGRRFSFGGLNVNQHNVILGPQGIGKETPAKMLAKILDQIKSINPMFGTQAGKYEATTNPKGVNALHRAMSKSPSVMIIIPEAGQASRSLSGDKASVDAYMMGNFAIGPYRKFSVDSHTKPLPDVYAANYVSIEEGETGSYAHQLTLANLTSGKIARKNIHFLNHKVKHSKQLRNNFSKDLILKIIKIMAFGLSTEKFSESTCDHKWSSCNFTNVKEEDRVYLMPDEDTENILDEMMRDHAIYTNSVEDTNTLEWAQAVRKVEKIKKEACLYGALRYIMSGCEEPIVIKDDIVEATEYILECDRSLEFNSYLLVADIGHLVKEMYKYYLRFKKSANYNKKHTAQERKLNMMHHSFIFGGETSISKLINLESENSGVDRERLIEKIYDEGEARGFWDYLHPKTFSIEVVYAKLGLKKTNKKTLIMRKIDEEDLK